MKKFAQVELLDYDPSLDPFELIHFDPNKL